MSKEVKKISLEEEKLRKFGILCVPVQARVKQEKENNRNPMEPILSVDVMGWGFRGKLNLKKDIWDSVKENDFYRLYFKTKAAGTKVTLDVVRFHELDNKVNALDPVMIPEVMVTGKSILKMDKKEKIKDENGNYMKDENGDFIEQLVKNEAGLVEKVDYFRVDVTGNGLSTTFTVPAEIYDFVEELNIYTMEFGFKTVEGKMIMDLVAVYGADAMEMPQEGQNA